MDIVMLRTIPGESINAGRTTQTFLKGATYSVPDEIGQLWIGRGWAEAADGLSGPSGLSGGPTTGQTKQTRQTSSPKE